MNSNLKAGLFGIGLATYWPQFDGLLDKLTGYQESIKNRLAGYGIEVVDAGMVDNPVKAHEAADHLKKADVDILFLYVSTYALSSTVLPVARKLKVPVVILNLQPVPQLNYKKFNDLGDRANAAIPGITTTNGRISFKTPAKTITFFKYQVKLVRDLFEHGLETVNNPCITAGFIYRDESCN